MDVSARDLRFLAIGAVACLGLTTLISTQYRGNIHRTCRIIESPLPLVQKTLSEQEQKRLPYAPDALEGARDVETPFGSIRVYEWGPEEGSKVLMVHGISTPCIALSGLAEKLVKKGCRVMLFDLFGRGFSSTPDPISQPQDFQLFTTQIHLVLSSSPIPWTGSQNRFSMIGYSLGGGIAASFASYFPNLVESLILIAPAGLMRASHIHWTSKLLYSGFLPQKLVEWVVWRRLGGASDPSSTSPNQADDETITPTKAVEGETPPPSHPALTPDSSAPVSTRRPSISIADVVAWQLQHHAGFIPAFVSSIQHAPISNQHPRWKLIARHQQTPTLSLRKGKILLVLGKSDTVVPADETAQDAREIMGPAVETCVLDGGHEVPITHPQAVANAIIEFWGQER